jgi:Icc-related predicted phosphoesterase
MRLVCITDLHGALPTLERVLAQAGKLDAVLLGGDITHFGSPVDAELAVRVAQRHAPLVLAVVGNTDSAAIEQHLMDLGVSAHGRGVVCGPVGLHGLSGIPPWKSGMYSLREDELAAALESGYAQIAGCTQHILLAHVPPRGTGLDRTFAGVHAGSSAVRKFVDQRRPALVLCGHIHEARGIEKLGPTTVVNCGHGGSGSHALVEAAQEVRVELRDA